MKTQMGKLHLWVSLYIGISKAPIVSRSNKSINLLDLIQRPLKPMEIILATSKGPLAA